MPNLMFRRHTPVHKPKKPPLKKRLYSSLMAIKRGACLPFNVITDTCFFTDDCIHAGVKPFSSWAENRLGIPREQLAHLTMSCGFALFCLASLPVLTQKPFPIVYTAVLGGSTVAHKLGFDQIHYFRTNMAQVMTPIEALYSSVRLPLIFIGLFDYVFGERGSVSIYTFAVSLAFYIGCSGDHGMLDKFKSLFRKPVPIPQNS